MFCGKMTAEVLFLSLTDLGDVTYMPVLLEAVYLSALRFITCDIYSTHQCILYIKSWASFPLLGNGHFISHLC